MPSYSRPVSYEDRCVRLADGTALVWPFVNQARGQGPYTLYLDANALNRTKWMDLLPPDIRERAVLMVQPALAEQWLSNPQFRNDPVKRVTAMLAPVVAKGYSFGQGFAEEFVESMKAGEEEMRTQWSLLMPYIALMKALQSFRIGTEEARTRLHELAQGPVARFTGGLLLLWLMLLLKENQRFKLGTNKQSAYSDFDSFLAYQPSKKNEPEFISAPYLRNRAGDLLLWYWPMLCGLLRIQFEGDLVIVTNDKALHRLFFQALPYCLESDGSISFAIDRNTLGDAMADRLIEMMKGVAVPEFQAPEVRAQRIHALYQFAQSFCTRSEEKDAIEETWNTWCQPALAQSLSALR